MIFLTLIFGILVRLINSVKVSTGSNSIYNQQQEVYIGYINLDQDASTYYQYFKSLNSDENKKLTFYLGCNVTNSAQAYGYMGFMPYTMTVNKTSKIGVDIAYNSKSLNSLTDIVVVDIVRGGGFSNNNSPKKVTFESISQDLEQFIKIFKATYDIKQQKIIVYGCYEMSMPAALYASRQSAPHVVDLILQNPWIGYTSFNQLYYQLPAYGQTDREGLDMISTKIYNLQSSDYGKDLQKMNDDLNMIREYLQNSIIVNQNNPVLDQTLATNFTEGYTYFLEDCKTCRAFCSLQKVDWSTNSTLRNMLMKDLIIDQTDSLSKLLSQIKGRTLIIHGVKSLIGSIQNLIEYSPNLGRVGGGSNLGRNNDGDSSNDDKVTVRFLRKSGFYAFIDEPDLMLSTIDDWLKNN